MPLPLLLTVDEAAELLGTSRRAIYMRLERNEDVQRLKASLEHKSPKTVNNVLNVLSVLLKRAVEWKRSSGCRAR